MLFYRAIPTFATFLGKPGDVLFCISSMKTCLHIILAGGLTLGSQAGTYYWTAGGDGSSIYQEANWNSNSDGTGTSIPIINANTAVDHDLILNSGTPGGGGGGARPVLILVRVLSL